MPDLLTLLKTNDGLEIVFFAFLPGFIALQIFRLWKEHKPMSEVQWAANSIVLSFLIMSPLFFKFGSPQNPEEAIQFSVYALLLAILAGISIGAWLKYSESILEAIKFLWANRKKILRRFARIGG